MAVHFLTSGSLASVQDYGRSGLMHQGISHSGAMDYISLSVANILVNNPPSAGAVEFRMLAPVMYFDEDCNIAVTGGDFTVSVDDISYSSYTAIKVKAGSTVRITPGKCGVYGYIAFGGGINIAPYCGSVSTNSKCSIGGIEGRCIKSGDSVTLSHPLYAAQNLSGRNKSGILSSYMVSDECETTVLHTVGCVQTDIFTSESLKAFYSDKFVITSQSDRMGIRLDSASDTLLTAGNGCDIISDAIVPGNIQITNKGKPIILTSDCQTTGGYAKIASVITSDLPRLVQLRPDSSVRFEKVTIDDARERYTDSFGKLKLLERNLISPIFD